MLWGLVKKSVHEWESLLPHAEFAYNRSTSQATGYSLFQVVYGINPISTFDLSPIHIDNHFVMMLMKELSSSNKNS